MNKKLSQAILRMKQLEFALSEVSEDAFQEAEGDSAQLSSLAAHHARIMAEGVEALLQFVPHSKAVEIRNSWA